MWNTRSASAKPTRSTLSLLLSVWIAFTLSFVALRVLPGDTVEAQLQAAGASPKAIAQRRAILGLDRPLPEQYFRYLLDLAHGDLGRSLSTSEPATNMIAARIFPTSALAAASLLIAVLVGLLLGMLSTQTLFLEAQPLLNMIQQSSHIFTTLILAAPIYWTSTLVIYLLSKENGFLPWGQDRIFIPALILGIHSSGAIAQITAASLRETLRQPFIQTAHAKGLPPEMVFEHALRVGLLPVLSVIALQAGFLLSGTVIIEVIFTRRGLGSLMYQAVLNQDYPVVQGLVLLSALIYTLTRIAADQLRRLADPRL